MGNFKLLAIKTGNRIKKNLKDSKGVPLDFLKVLKPNTLYQFTKEYQFKLIDTEEIDSETKNPIQKVDEIEYKPTIPENLFYTKNNLPVWITAIVGKNGSGKSTILELLFVAIYNFAVGNSILEKNKKGKVLEMMVGVDAEIYYLLNDNIIRLKVFPKLTKSELKKSKDSIIEIVQFKDTKEKRKFRIGAVLKNKNEIFSDYLFYTIGINYSHYSLNSKNLGEWVKNIFHKNDGYQAPIVLNPFRIDGVIDINKEEYLTKSRLVSNLITRSDDEKKLIFSEVIKDKYATKIQFKLNKKKVEIDKGFKPIYDVFESNKEKILEPLFTTFFDQHFSISNKQITTILSENENNHGTLKYIFKKIHSITEKYYPYNTPEYQFIKKSTKRKSKSEAGNAPEFIEGNLRKFFHKLNQDDSHVTFKLKQAINYLVNYSAYQELLGGFIDIDIVSKKIYEFKKNDSDLLIHLIPPSFFDIDIEFGDKSYFSKLSSGEKQQIFSSTTYLYHVINLNSVLADNGLIKYKYVNIVFDEIELYFHPEMQKAFVKNIIDNLSKIDVPNIKGVNCLLITHSPFILSDIPDSNILKLEAGSIFEPKKKEETFGSNIHDLLANDFFMVDGFMGAWANEKIEEAIRFLNYNQIKLRIEFLTSLGKKMNKKEQVENGELKLQFKKLQVDFNTDLDYQEKIISLVGEPLIKNKLNDMFYEIYRDKLKVRIARKKINDIAFEAGINIDFKEV